MRYALLLAVTSIALLSCGGAEHVYPDADFPDGIEIAPIEDALTFARIEVNGKPEVLAVSTYEGGRVTGFNLSKALGGRFTDPVDIFQELGYDKLQALIAAGLVDAPLQVSVIDLVLPLELTDAHVAAGTNFAAHADESSVEDGPFLFAKLVTPTPFRSAVRAGNALLDYETELAFVALSEIELPEVPEYMGLILANDFTDRAALLRNINPSDVTSGDGFTTGKSAEGFLPVGNLFVIPRDLDPFANAIELNLAVNGKLRQNGEMTLAIWNIHELLRQTHAERTTRWLHDGEQVGLPVTDEVLPARTLIISGTPAGTVFNGLTKRNMASGVLGWAAGGWGQSIADHVIEAYIAEAQADGRYLQPGDQVFIHVEHMGAIETVIEE